MNVEVRWNNVPSYNASLIGPILSKEVSRLGRHFNDSGTMDVNFRREGERIRARVHVQALGRDWWVTGEGDNVGQGLTNAFEALMRKISEFKRYTRDHINKRFQRPDPATLF